MYGGYAAILCACCLLGGMAFLFLFFPHFNLSASAREQIIANNRRLSELYFFLVWIVVGLCFILVNNALIKINKSKDEFTPVIITLLCFCNACYMFTVGSIEIVNTELLFIEQAQNNFFYKNFSLNQGVFELLIRLRANTEWAGDIWLISINMYLLQKNKIHKALAVMGEFIGILGFIILVPTYSVLAPLYVMFLATWFILIGKKLLNNVQSQT